jgi:hypothetical protein
MEEEETLMLRNSLINNSEIKTLSFFKKKMLLRNMQQ